MEKLETKEERGNRTGWRNATAEKICAKLWIKRCYE
jgi:hypothetical protein